jgi:hypothetical protein
MGTKQEKLRHEALISRLRLIQPRQDLNGNVRAISFILGKGEKKQ